MKKLPSIFTNGSDETLSLVYTGDSVNPTPWFSAVSVETMLGTKNPYGSTTSRVNSVLSRIDAYNADNPDSVHLAPHTEVLLLGSVKPAEIVGDDGVYTVLGVKSSRKSIARLSYYYNEAALFYVLTTAKTEMANHIQHWINGEVLPAIVRSGEYTISRRLGIESRGRLTDAVKEQIEAKTLTEKAYPNITDAIYFIRFGCHSDHLRGVLGLSYKDNIRDHLSQEDLDVISQIESTIAGGLTLGMPLGQILSNGNLINKYRRSPKI